MIYVDIEKLSTYLDANVVGISAMKKHGIDKLLDNLLNVSESNFNIKYDEKVYSPLIFEGEADYLLAFEELEAYRWLPYLKKGGTIISNTAQIDPMPVITGAAEYPVNVLEELKAKGFDIDDFDALMPAMEAGSAKSVNIVLMGHLSRSFPFAEEEWMDAIEKSVPAKFLELNKKAFALGREFGV